ncbi:MAG: cytochrome c [Chlorobi bacterium]|nr:cytochrome c [Chlorobiota bacterium]
MDIFDNNTLSQSFMNLELLKIVLFISNSVLFSYVGIAFGTLVLSLTMKGKSTVAKDPFYFEFSRYLVSSGIFKKTAGIIFGVAPLLASMFVYTILLQTSEFSVSADFYFTMWLLIAAFVLLYVYRISLNTKEVLSVYSGKENNESLKNKLSNLSAFSALALFLLSMYILVGENMYIMTVNSRPANNSLLNILFDNNTLIEFSFFFSFAFMFAALFSLVDLFNGGSKFAARDAERGGTAKRFLIKTAMIFVLFLPALYFIKVISVPKEALSSSFFGTVIFIMFLLFMISVYLYYMYKEEKIEFRGAAFYAGLLLISFIALQNEFAFNTANALNEKALLEKYNADKIEMEEAIGIFSIPKLTGEDIFKAKCSACHTFETKLVGPPYNETVPKYKEDIAGLKDFIAHPRKIREDFPIMPDQGLKPEEVDSIAAYLLSHFK